VYLAMEPNTMASFDDEVRENKTETCFLGFVLYQILSFGFTLKSQRNVHFVDAASSFLILG